MEWQTPRVRSAKQILRRLFGFVIGKKNGTVAEREETGG
jgi:hypothetical protein